MPGLLYRALFGLVLRRIPPERAHALAFAALDRLCARPRPRRALRRLTQPPGETLRVAALGLTFPSPLGVAAGLDKDAAHVESLGALGFGFVEVGTVTPLPQASNPRPIIARLPRDRALINRMGFPSAGARAVAARLRLSPRGGGETGREAWDDAGRGGERGTIVGVNIGKNRDTDLTAAAADYRRAARALAPLAGYLALNVSSPNTPGLRGLEQAAALRALVGAVQAELEGLGTAVPLLVKISPDLSDEGVDAVADVALALGVAGIIATNTTVSRDRLCTPDDETTHRSWAQGGGISGRPLQQRSLAVLRRLHARVGSRLVLISVGGVESTDDVWQRILAGATLVEVYTGFIYGGPAWPRQVTRELARRVEAAGVRSIAELIGSQSDVRPFDVAHASPTG